MRTTLLLVIAALPFVAAPAFAATDAAATAPSIHQGVAFTASKTAKARIVEPDGRVILTDSVSDLVAPSAIAERRARVAIAGLIRTAAAEKAAKAAPTPADSKQLQEP